MRTRRRVQPSDIRLAVATMSIRIVIRRINAATGVVAAESSGTNALAPAYEGHIGPLPGIALRTIAAGGRGPQREADPERDPWLQPIGRRPHRHGSGDEPQSSRLDQKANGARAEQDGELELQRLRRLQRGQQRGEVVDQRDRGETQEGCGNRQKEPHRELTAAPGHDGGDHPRDHHHDRDQHAGSLRDGRDGLRVSLGAFPVLGNEHEPPQIRDLVAPDAARQSKLAPRQCARTVGKRDQPVGALRQLRRHRGYFPERCGVDGETGPRWRAAPAAGPLSRPATDRCATRAARGSCR